jgi:hypothetical protein
VRGSVFTRQQRCGKATCHCARGTPHRATYLGVSFAGGRTVQDSLPPALVATARRWVANYQAWWKAIETVSAINRDLLRRRGVTPSASAEKLASAFFILLALAGRFTPAGIRLIDLEPLGPASPPPRL